MSGILLSQPGGSGTVDGTVSQPASYAGAILTNTLCLPIFSGATTSWTWSVTGPSTVTVRTTSPYSARAPAFEVSVPGPYVIHFTDSGSNSYTLTVWARNTLAPRGSADESTRDLTGWGKSNAAFFNSSNGAWYKDAALTVEADDDAWKLQAAIDYAYLQGGGAVYVSRGTWYLKTRQGLNGEFALLRSGVNLFGDGNSSVIMVDRGATKAAYGGYSACVGSNDSVNAVTNSSVSSIKFDCNSKFNQYENPARAGVAYQYGAACLVLLGSNITYDNVTVEGPSGTFALIIGNYGDPTASVNDHIRNCHINHICDDPNFADTSVLVLACTNGSVTKNVLSNGVSIAHPLGAPVSAMEVHGFNIDVSGNVTQDIDKSLNLAGDSYDSAEINVHHNVFRNNIVGVALFQGFGKKMSGVDVNNNLITVRAGTLAGGGEGGIVSGVNGTLGWPDGLGIHDSRIHDNEIRMEAGQTGTPAASWGINVGFNTGVPGVGGGFQIYDNKIHGFATGGIAFGSAAQPNTGIVKTFTASGATLTSAAHGLVQGNVGRLTTTGMLPAGLAMATDYYVVFGPGTNTFGLALAPGVAATAIVTTTAGTGTHTFTQKASNYHADLLIKHNRVQNCGTFGIYVAGFAGEVATTHWRTSILSNETTDSKSVATMQYGTRVIAYTDAFLAMWDNKSLGHTVADVSLDTTTYPLAGQYHADVTTRTLTVGLDGIGANEVPAVLIENNTPATALATNQFSPSAYWAGAYWTGSVSQRQVSWDYLVPAVNPAMLRQVDPGTGIPKTLFYGIYYTASDITGWSGSVNLLIDQSTANGALDLRYSTAGTLKVTKNSGATVLMTADANGDLVFTPRGGNQQLKLDNTGIGFYTTAPIAKPTVTGSRGANAALTSLLTALASQGLVIDSSS